MTRPIPVAPFDGTATVRCDLSFGPEAIDNVRVRVLAAVSHDHLGPPQFLVEYVNEEGNHALGYAVEVKPWKS